MHGGFTYFMTRRAPPKDLLQLYAPNAAKCIGQLLRSVFGHAVLATSEAAPLRAHTSEEAKTIRVLLVQERVATCRTETSCVTRTRDNHGLRQPRPETTTPAHDTLNAPSAVEK